MTPRPQPCRGARGAHCACTTLFCTASESTVICSFEALFVWFNTCAWMFRPYDDACRLPLPRTSLFQVGVISGKGWGRLVRCCKRLRSPTQDDTSLSSAFLRLAVSCPFISSFSFFLLTRFVLKLKNCIPRQALHWYGLWEGVPDITLSWAEQVWWKLFFHGGDVHWCPKPERLRS